MNPQNEQLKVTEKANNLVCELNCDLHKNFSEKGAKSTETVKSLQDFLNTVLCLDNFLKVDGKYGTSTKKTIKRYQKLIKPYIKLYNVAHIDEKTEQIPQKVILNWTDGAYGTYTHKLTEWLICEGNLEAVSIADMTQMKQKELKNVQKAVEKKQEDLELADWSEEQREIFYAIKHAEGFDYKRRWDNKQWSIGFGRKAKKGEMYTNLAKERKNFLKTVAPYVKSVEKHFTGPLTAKQKAGLVSFTYNLGKNCWTKPNYTSCKQIIKKVNAGDFQVEHLMLNYLGKVKKEREGLRNRRIYEAKLVSGVENIP